MDVLCKNCRYFVEWEKYCKYVLKHFKHYKGEQLVRSTMQYLNEKADCSYYKKKWWRLK